MAKGRLIVTYSDGTWTDNLSVRKYSVDLQPHSVMLAIDVVAREAREKAELAKSALSNLARRQLSVHTIQIGAPEIRSKLKGQMRRIESSRLELSLRGKGLEVTYPAGIVFGPDAVTLHLG